MPTDPNSIATLLTNAGFVGVTAWLLYERWQSAREFRLQAAAERENLVEVVKENTGSNQRVADAVVMLKETNARLADEVKDVREVLLRVR